MRCLDKSWQPGWTRGLMSRLKLFQGPRLEDLRVGYELAGLTVYEEPVPWNADTTLVEVRIWFPDKQCPHKDDFTLERTHALPIPAHSCRCLEPEVFLVVFRLPALQGRTTVIPCWRGRELTRVTLPFLSAEDFFHRLRLNAATNLAQLDGAWVPCQAVVDTRFHGLQVGGLLTSPTSLLPLAHVGLSVTFRNTSTRETLTQSVPRLGCQQSDRQALLNVSWPGMPTDSGNWLVQWSAGTYPLTNHSFRVLTRETFESSLYLVDGHYLYQDERGVKTCSSSLPPRERVRQLAPCFRVASQEPGVAAFCDLEIRTHRVRSMGPPLRHHLPRVLVTAAPVLVQLPFLKVDDFEQIEAFELIVAERSLRVLPARPRPVATFTAEGGFLLPAEPDWTHITDEDVADRLRELMSDPDLHELRWPASTS